MTGKTDPRLLELMRNHYSQPKGFVGRSCCYAITYDGDFYGYIVAGSTPAHLPGREKIYSEVPKLDNIVNNVFYSVSKVNGRYPLRNFTTYVLEHFVERCIKDWPYCYFNRVKGFETLIELPRTGELYRRAGWQELGVTKGYTCKRVGGQGTDDWGGRRVWNTVNLRPKLVLGLAV